LVNERSDTELILIFHILEAEMQQKYNGIWYILGKLINLNQYTLYYKYILGFSVSDIMRKLYDMLKSFKLFNKHALCVNWKTSLKIVTLHLHVCISGLL